MGASMQPRIDRRVVLPLPEGPIRTVKFAAVDGQVHVLQRLHPCWPAAKTLLTLTASMMELVIASAQPQGRRE